MIEIVFPSVSLLMQRLILTVWCTVAISFCSAALFDKLDDLRSADFDFIVVGVSLGGAAGAVVANRLTEDPSVSVLLIEAGPSSEGILDAEVPALQPFMVGGFYDWNFTSKQTPY
ncbi:hypothetical protein VKT23_001296 [Stygiomarasmius scandens]|uniref:Glucose-methanol-choline oxidoreductase N-terminal domain-containing protein n=1 Tax=Marasmiellus scandens TaxID=2682957 RepID=A0ABR1K707_9AGAR